MSDGTYTDYLKGETRSPNLAGDPHDDDAQYIEELVDTNSFPVIPPTGAMVEPPAQPVKAQDRLLSGFQIFNSDITFLLLPADPWRKSLNMYMPVASDGNDRVLVADEKSKLELPAATYVLSRSGQAWLVTTVMTAIDSYTGPVWVRAMPAVAGPMTFQWLAVTSAPIK